MQRTGSPVEGIAATAAAGRVGFWAGFRDALGLCRRLLGVTQVEVTSVCPNQCGYCPRTVLGRHWKSRHMQPDTFVRLLPLFRESVRVHLQGWGEPLEHPGFLDMVDLARKAGCSVSTTTSGRRMTRDLAAALVESGLDVVAFSLAGATAETNDSLRFGIPFERVLESIRLLQEVRRARGGVHLEIHIAYLLMAGRQSDIALLPGLMQELGVHATVVSTLDGSLVPGWRGECFGPEERVKVLEARRELESAAAQARSLGLDFHFSLPASEPTGRCFEDAERSVFIDAEGNVAPCVHLNLPTTLDDPRRRVFGSCLTGDPMAVWRSGPYIAFRAALATSSPDPACRGCLKRYASGNAS
jgi:MoaA/NifB/PqqE/SkfB family radical SAM enzyme